MFLHLSVSHSVHRGGRRGVSLSACWDTPPIPPGRYPPRQIHPLAGTPHPPGKAHPHDGHCSGRYASYRNAFLLSVAFTSRMCVCVWEGGGPSKPTLVNSRLSKVNLFLKFLLFCLPLFSRIVH